MAEISEKGQEVAEQQGVAFSALKNVADVPSDYGGNYDAQGLKDTIGNTTNIKEGSTYINPAEATVSGQLDRLLASDSKYIQQAREQGREEAASRGMLNSTAAMEASQREAIKAALPIAQQDAQTYAGFAATQQGAENAIEQMQAEGIVSAGITEQKALINRKDQDIQNAFTGALNLASEQSKTYLADLQNEYNVGLQNLDAALRTELAQFEVDSDKYKTTSTLAADVMKNFQISVENMLQDPEFLELGPEAINNAVNELQELAKNTVGFIAASQGLDDVGDLVDTYWEDLGVLTEEEDE